MNVDNTAAQHTLSVCVMTAGPGPRVAALLELLRPVATELVVALDDRAAEEVEAAVAAVADEVVRYPYREPVDRPLRWLFSLCHGAWILNIDDDEVPSAELLEALPSLVEATDVTHYWLLRRWLWPDAGSTIAEHPWSTDYQLRLVRNDPLLLRFPSETHRPIEALGPHRFLRVPLYHADLVLNSHERRAEKARKYEALRPGKRIGGGPMNHVFHLPERRPGLRTAPLPERDLELVRAVLEAAAASSQRAPVVRRTTEDEIDRLWSGRELREEDYRARIDVVDEPARMLESEQRTFDVRVENLGTTLWPWGERGEPDVELSYQWLDADGKLVGYGVRTPLPADLGPGEAQIVPLHVRAPGRAGRYRLRLDLVHEHVRWFGSLVELDVDVERRLRVALSGEDGAVSRTLDQLAEEAPEFEPLVLRSDPCPPRFGPSRAPDLREYMLDGTARGRWRDLRLLAVRAFMLAGAAGKLRAGKPVVRCCGMPIRFLEELSACTHLLLVAETPEIGTRELAAGGDGARGAQARGPGRRTGWGRSPEGMGRSTGLLARFVRRRVETVGPRELGLR